MARRLLLITIAVIAIAAPPAAAAAAVASIHYSGNGNRTIATVKLPADSVVRWTASGGSFAMTLGKVKVSGRARAGQSFATRGTYRRVAVRAKGKWTVTFTPLPAAKH